MGDSGLKLCTASPSTNKPRLHFTLIWLLLWSQCPIGTPDELWFSANSYGGCPCDTGTLQASRPAVIPRRGSRPRKVDEDTHEFSSVRREVGFEAPSSYSYSGRRLGASFRLYTASLELTTMTTVPEIPHHVPAPPSKEECTRLLLTHSSDS